MRHLGERKGAVLIVVLGVLFILALLATTFATLQATEKQVARNYLDMVRAKLIAQSGAQDADARLREYFPSRYFESIMVGAPQSWKFWGQDKTETKEPDSTTNNRIEDALNPSFALEAVGTVPENPQNPENANIAPLNVTIDGKPRGISGVMGMGTYARNGDHYVLKITDLSGRIYVNDGVDQGKNGAVTQNLKRILNVLGDAISVKDLGTMIVDNRPDGGYRHPQDLLKAVNYDETIYNKVKDYVSVFAWVDPNVCLPVPLSQSMLSQYPVKYYRGTPPVYRMGSSKDANGKESAPPGGYMTCPTACSTLPHDNPAIRIYGLDVLNPQWIEIVSRAPVNVNTAPKEVLIALLTDLKGWYISDRRRNNPRWKGELYLSFKQQNSLSPAGTEGDEYGYLKETVPIVGPGGSTANGISASILADEIIACRNIKQSGSTNYASDPSNSGKPYPFAGPFRSWHQFEAFIDHLVTVKVIEDKRALHFDFEEETDDPTGFGQLVPSDLQKRQANQAVADVIKSNFNPNLHLNELNPDLNTFRLVDKTDLIVNSTEFNFLPTGHFEVEALGRVCRGANGAEDILLAGDHELVAQSKVTAIYKFYELYRETNQRQFYMGTFSPRGAGVGETNNNLSLESGPEPDNGRPPAENEYAGYISLPTMGSVYHSAPTKQKHSLVRTLQLGQTPQYGSAMHVHFTLDADAHHHVVDPKEIAGRGYTPAGVPNLVDEKVENHPDLNLNYPGPYDPTKGPGNPHRLARSFRQPPKTQGGGSATTQNLPKFAPSDLRIDGCYSERHSSPAYYTRTGANAIWNFSQEKATGLVSFWFKPSYFPELTGKVRQVWDLGRYHRPCGQNVFVWPFQMVFLPSHYNTSISEANQPKYWHNNMGQFHPASMYWGSKQWHGDEVTPIDSTHSGHEFGRITRSLNHIGHPDEKLYPSVMLGHRWVHAAFSWNLSGTSVQATPNTGLSKMWLNGSRNDVLYTYSSMTTWNEKYDKMWGFETHAGGEYNHLRLGAPSQIAQAAKVTALPGVIGAYRGNHTADFTVDEFYVWKNEVDAGNPLVTWLLGRYYKPDINYGEGKFTSQAITLLPSSVRMPPPPSNAVPSGGGGGTPPSSIPAEIPAIRVLGVSWSWYGEGIAPMNPSKPAECDWLPAIYDYNNPTGVGTINLEPRIRVTGILDGSVLHPTDPAPVDRWNDGYARIRTGKNSSGEPATIDDPKQLKYVVQFQLLKSSLSTILVVSPILDDVTLYWDDSRSHLLSYVFDSRSF